MAFALLIALLGAYRPAWHGQPLWDDDGHITKPELRSAGGLARIWTELGATQQYYPLVHTAFWLEYRLFGDATSGYHVVNILLHFLCAVLLVAILRGLAIPGAWLAGWIFALHPVMVESVAWITELKNTLSGVFFLGAALVYLSFDRQRKKRHYGFALALFCCGLLAKSVIATLPAALLVVFWWSRGRIGWKRDVVPLLPFFVIGIIAGLFTAWVERRFIGAVGSEFSFTILDRCLIAGRAVWFYLSKLLFPVELIFIYPRWRIDATAAWQYLFPIGLLLAAVLLYRVRNRSRAPLAVLLYFAGTLFPSLGFFNVYPFRYSFVADHFQYLAAIGPIVGAAAGIERGARHLVERHWRHAQRLLYGMLLSLLFLLSWRQSGMYTDGETLYRTTIQRNPDCWMAHYNLGILLATAGRADEAEAHYRKALALDPRHAKAHINLGILLAKTRRADEAVAHYQQALEINPRSAEAHYNLGYVLAGMGRTGEAADHLLEALRINPRHADAHNNLGNLLANTGQADEAVAHYLQALDINPSDNEIRNNLGIQLARMGRTDEALAQFRKALELGPQHADTHNNLGILLAKTNQTEAAIAHYRKALQINPDSPEGHNNLGRLLASTGKTEEAIAHFRKALAMDPRQLSLLKNLALALAQNGQHAEATSLLQNALVRARSAGEEGRARRLAEILMRLPAGENPSATDARRQAQP